jgi:succinate-semialdehyde dehydrogenase/glutarate-semialdehyde dehydrogenase
MDVLSPVTGDVVGRVTDTPAAEIESAYRRAASAVDELGAMTVWERADLLCATAAALEARRTEALRDHVLEHGKTAAQAEAELDTAINGLRSTAEHARRLDGRIPAVADRGKTVLTQRRSLGVVGAITPWNVPFMVPVEYGAPALAMGNSFLWKPAESVPATSAHMRAAFRDAGWPEGAVEMIEGGPATGAALARHPGLAALCFTGSSEVGNEIGGLGGSRRLILELGGNGPTVVFRDADLEAAADSIVAGSCFLSGQSCAATERVLVEHAVHDELLDALVERTRREHVGDPRVESTTLGPIHLADTASKIGRHVQQARDAGATVLTGGSPLPDAPTDRYWQPTVVSGVTPDMQMFREETFGPIMPVTGFATADEAIGLARVGRYGLSSAVFTQDIDRAFAVADALPASFVVVNDTSNYWEMHLPWGGGPGTSSGTGRLGGEHALHELSTTSTIVLNLSTRGLR